MHQKQILANLHSLILDAQNYRHEDDNRTDVSTDLKKISRQLENVLLSFKHVW